MIKAVLFDMYRTLGEDESSHTHFIDQLLQFGMTQSDAVRVMHVADVDAFDGKTHFEFSDTRDAYDRWRRSHLVEAITSTGMSLSLAHEIADRHHDWTLELASSMTAYPESREVLSELKARSIDVIVCSNWNWDADQVIAGMGLADVVDDVFASARLGVRKPHAAFFERILKARSLTADDVLFVGDTWLTDVVGALGVGMPVAWLDRLGQQPTFHHKQVVRIENLQGVLELATTV